MEGQEEPPMDKTAAALLTPSRDQTAEAPPPVRKSRIRAKHLSNNADFSCIKTQLAVDEKLIELDFGNNQSRPSHHRSVSDFVRPPSRSVSEIIPPAEIAIVADHGDGREMPDIDHGDDSGDESDDDDEIEIDPDQIDETKLAAAAGLQPGSDPEEKETIFGSIRSAVTASVRMAMDSRLAIRRNHHRMFRSLQKDIDHVDDGVTAAAPPGKNVFDQKNFRQCLHHPNLRLLGVAEVKRLWCALRFLIEEKDVERFLKTYTPNPSQGQDGDAASPNSKETTLQYTHRFSSTGGDAQVLAPSLEGLLRQQTLATNANNTQRQGSLVLRSSMPNERAVVARGLASNHQFRRASMAAVETSPIIDKLGFNSEMIELLISRDFLDRELERCRALFDQSLQPLLDCQSSSLPLPPIVSVRANEKRVYKNLCAFLYACLTHEQGGSKYMMKLIQAALSYLRSIEECESSRVCKGFVNKIDNYLAVLLFRDSNPHHEMSAAKSEVPPLITKPRSKSTLSTRTTEEYGASTTSLTTAPDSDRPLAKSLPASASSPPEVTRQLLLLEAIIVTFGFVALLVAWLFLYPPSISSASDRYVQHLSRRITSAFAVDRSVFSLFYDESTSISSFFVHFSATLAVGFPSFFSNGRDRR